MSVVQTGDGQTRSSKNADVMPSNGRLKTRGMAETGPEKKLVLKGRVWDSSPRWR